MVGQSPSDASLETEQGLDCEPLTVLQIALETDCDGPRVRAALDTLTNDARIAVVIEQLRHAPVGSRLADELWPLVATPARLRVELSAQRVDFPLVESLASRLGPKATEPLLDLLEQSVEAAVRARTFRLLEAIGPTVAPAAAARLSNAPWYVQRNLLALLRALRTWPAGFSAVTYARDPEPRLRREAYKLLLEFPPHRTSAIVHGLEDASPEIVTLVLRAAIDSCPPEALRAVERLTEDWRRPGELRALAIRVVAGHSGPQALNRLLQLSGARKHLFGWRLESKSPVMLATLAALARYWSAHPQVQNVLAVARSHDDPEIRRAATLRFT